MRRYLRTALTAEQHQLLGRALEGSPLFRGIESRMVGSFVTETLVEIRYCSVGESIFGGPDGGPSGLYIVLDGMVEVFRVIPPKGHRSGKTRRKITVGLYGVGDIFGEIGLLCGPRTRTAEVMPFQGLMSGTCSVALCERSAVLQFLKTHADCCFNLLTEEARRLQRASDLLVLGVEARLLHSLLHVAEAQYGNHDFLTVTATPLTLKCSQRMLAELVGCTREWINQQLAEMARSGRGIRTRADSIVIDDPSTFFSGLRYNVPQ